MVTQKALALAEAGLRVDARAEPLPDAVRDLAFDFYGGRRSIPGSTSCCGRPKRATTSRARSARRWPTRARRPAAPIAYERTRRRDRRLGPDFISFAVAGGGGGPPVDVTIYRRAGRQHVARHAARGDPDVERRRAPSCCRSGRPGRRAVLGLVTVAHRADPTRLDLQLAATQASYQSRVTLPRGDGTFVRAASPGDRSRRAARATRPRPVAGRPGRSRRTSTATALRVQPAVDARAARAAGPQLVSATIVGPETFDSARAPSASSGAAVRSPRRRGQRVQPNQLRDPAATAC